VGNVVAPTPMRGESRFVETDRGRVHVLEYGDSVQPALIVVPGITSVAMTWEFVALELARDFHTFTVDVRGRGLSDPGTGHTFADYARDVAAIAQQLGLHRPAVLGHSAGARIVATFGVLHPELRGPLILADPPLSGPGRAPYPTSLDEFLEQIRLGRTQPTVDDLRPFFPSMAEDHLALRAAWLSTCDETAVAETYRGFHEEDFFDFWPLLRPPVLFLWGGASPVVTEESAIEVAAANPGAETVCLAGAGHMLPWDDLPGFLGAVREFLDRGVQAHAEAVGARAGIDA
jgi:N-formylmaleamate deformylase